MRTMKLGKSDLQVPVVAVGCMRINGIDKNEAERFVKVSLDEGLNFFDHADIYGDGECESIFADAIGMNSMVRDEIYLQSKCGIKIGIEYDFRKEYILSSVDGILKRLKTDYLDMLILHRPDALVEPEAVAEALDQLEGSGKVSNFGVSNHTPMQIQLLQKYVKQPIVTNQLRLSVTHSQMITSGMHMNMSDDYSINRDGEVLDFCRLNDITIQPWSPFQHGTNEGIFLDHKKYPELNAKIDKIAAKYNVSNTTIAMAWLLRHPARMQPVTGTMNIDRLRDCAKATEIKLTHQEWYQIYMATGVTLP